MMTALRIRSVGRRPSESSLSLRASAYELVASWLLASLLVAGPVAFCLFVIWLSMGMFPLIKSVRVDLVQVQPSGGHGDELTLEPPRADEVSAALTDPEFQSTLQTIVDAAAVREAALANLASLEEEPKRGVGHSGTTAAAGTGVGGDKTGIPPHLRWEIDFGDVDTLDTYARKLDFFGIELGAYGVPGRGQVTYAKNLSRPMPDVRVGTATDEKRLYMSWRRGPLKNADRDLAIKAGMPAGRMLLQFFSAETEQALMRVEHDFHDRDAATIRKTRFGIRPIGKGYEFFVIDQQP